MNKCILFVCAFMLFVIVTTAQQMRSFTPGNFVVISQNIPSGFAPVFIKEYTPTGNLVQVGNLGTLSAPNNPCYLPNPNTGSSEYGYLSRSSNGQFISFAAFGQPNMNGNRVGVLIKFNGTINSQTIFNNSDNSIFIPKSAVTADGKGIWLSTSHLSGDSNYIFYQPVNAVNNPTQLIESPDKGLGFRQLNISAFDNSLYITRGNSAFNAFNGLPNTLVPRTNRVPPINVKAPSAGGRGYCFVQPIAGGGEVMYVGAVATYSANGSVTEGSNIVTLVATNNNFAVGNSISGPGIPIGAVIKSNEGNTITISVNATASQSLLSYYTSPAAGFGIYKFYRSSPKNSWTALGGFGVSSDNYLTVTATPNPNGGFTLYATKYNHNGGSIKYTNVKKDGITQIVRITDTSVFNATMAAKEDLLVYMATNRDVFRGIAMAPTASSNPAIFYYKGEGSVDAVTSWGSNYDGSGSSPANFSTDNQIFILTNADVVDKFNGKTWAITGANAALYIGDGYNKVQFVTGNKTVTINGEKVSEKQVNNNSKLN